SVGVGGGGGPCVAGVSLFFFIQAEDGIRDGHVTGVQTCALPICGSAPRSRGADPAPRATRRRIRAARSRSATARRKTILRKSSRSEERRVGKECRARRSA